MSVGSCVPPGSGAECAAEATVDETNTTAETASTDTSRRHRREPPFNSRMFFKPPLIDNQQCKCTFMYIAPHARCSYSTPTGIGSSMYVRLRASGVREARRRKGVLETSYRSIFLGLYTAAREQWTTQNLR